VSPVSRDFGRKSQFWVEKNVSGRKKPEERKKEFTVFSSIAIILLFVNFNTGDNFFLLAELRPSRPLQSGDGNSVHLSTP
jgi:hypothetical protein